MIAALPRYQDGRMVADVVRPIPYAAGKVHNLRARIGETRTLVAAFGDNAFDVAMLSQASVPVAVRPKQRLRDRAADVQLLVEIARES
jgi:phosphoserine phosphatase